MWPSLSIWIKPEVTFKKLAQLPADVIKKKISLIILLIAISEAFFFQIVEASGISFKSVAISLLITPIFYLGNYYIFPWFLLWVSRLFKGTANIKNLRIVVAYSILPYLFNGLMVIAVIIDWYLIKDSEIFRLNITATNWIVAFLSIRFFVYGLSYFNKYSYLYALITILIFKGSFEVLQFLLRY